MLDLQPEHASTYSSIHTMYHSDDSYISTKTTFGFWDEGKTTDYESFDSVGEGELEFQTHTWIEDDYIVFSPQPWKKSTTQVGRYESSPLLPNNHHYSHPSSKSRLQGIVNAQKGLMEMIQDIPESSLELSLKDLVNNQQDLQLVQQDKESNLKVKKEVKINQKKKVVKKPPISRSESMDSGMFLLKMFFPHSLGLKRKPKPANHSKIAPILSFTGSEKPDNRHWWNIWSLITGDSKCSSSRKSTSNTNSTSSSCSRYASSDSLQSCCSFNSEKCKSRMPKGCLFRLKMH